MHETPVEVEVTESQMGKALVKYITRSHCHAASVFVHCHGNWSHLN